MAVHATATFYTGSAGPALTGTEMKKVLHHTVRVVQTYENLNKSRLAERFRLPPPDPVRDAEIKAYFARLNEEFRRRTGTDWKNWFPKTGQEYEPFEPETAARLGMSGVSMFTRIPVIETGKSLVSPAAAAALSGPSWPTEQTGDNNAH